MASPTRGGHKSASLNKNCCFHQGHSVRGAPGSKRVHDGEPLNRARVRGLISLTPSLPRGAGSPNISRGLVGSGGAETPPLHQMERVPTLAPQHRADRARIGKAVGLLHDSRACRRGELATLGFVQHLGMGDGRGRRRPGRHPIGVGFDGFQSIEPRTLPRSRRSRRR